MNESAIQLGIAPMGFPAVSEFGRQCEALGADLVSVGEGATEFRDPFMSLADLSTATERVRLTVGVTTPRLRHPAVAANAFATLQERSEGRAVIGLGSGDLGLTRLGEQPVRLAELEEYATAVRALASGEPLHRNDTTIQIGWATQPVPLFLAADGPRMLELAGRIADGVIVGQAGHPDIVRLVHDRVTAAATAAGRSSEDVEIWYMLRAVVTGDGMSAIRHDGFDEYGARQAYFLWRVCGSPDRVNLVDAVHRRKGLLLDDDTADRYWRYVSDYSEEAAWGTKHNVSLLDRHGLTDWAGDLFYVSGHRDRVRSGIEQLIAAGARNFIVPAKHEPSLDEQLDRIRPITEVFAQLRSDPETGRGSHATTPT